jgi:hypothetical protein
MTEEDLIRLKKGLKFNEVIKETEWAITLINQFIENKELEILNIQITKDNKSSKKYFLKIKHQYNEANIVCYELNMPFVKYDLIKFLQDYKKELEIKFNEL